MSIVSQTQILRSSLAQIGQMQQNLACQDSSLFLAAHQASEAIQNALNTWVLISRFYTDTAIVPFNNQMTLSQKLENAQIANTALLSLDPNKKFDPNFWLYSLVLAKALASVQELRNQIALAIPPENQ